MQAEKMESEKVEKNQGEETKIIESKSNEPVRDSAQDREHEFRMSKPEGLVSRLQNYIQENLSDVIIVTILASLTVIKFAMESQLSSLYFFFIIVLGAGYALGKRFAVLTAFLTILVVWAFILSDQAAFSVQYSSDILNWYMTLWGGFLVLTGWLGSAIAKSVHSWDMQMVMDTTAQQA